MLQGSSVNQSGLFIAGTESGDIDVKAEVSGTGIFGLATVTIEPDPLAIVLLTPDAATLQLEGIEVFTATATDEFKNVKDLPLVFSIEGDLLDSTLATQTAATVRLTASTTAGTVTLLVAATEQGNTIEARATIVIEPGPLDAIEISPTTTILFVSDSKPFTATATDAFGNVKDLPMVWSVATPAAGTIEDTTAPTALFTATTTVATSTTFVDLV